MTLTDTPTRRPCDIPYTRLSFEPLERWLYVNYGPDDEIGAVTVGTERVLTDGFIARHVHRNRGVVSRWRTDGIPLLAGDDIAYALGLFPTDLWHDFHHLPLRQDPT